METPCLTRTNRGTWLRRDIPGYMEWQVLLGQDSGLDTMESDYDLQGGWEDPMPTALGVPCLS